MRCAAHARKAAKLNSGMQIASQNALANMQNKAAQKTALARAKAKLARARSAVKQSPFNAVAQRNLFAAQAEYLEAQKQAK